MSEQNVQVTQASANDIYAVAFENRQNAQVAENIEFWDRVIGWLSNIFNARLPDEPAHHRTRAEPDLVEAAVASLHPAWFASDYNHREAQRAVRAALSRSGEGNHAG